MHWHILWKIKQIERQGAFTRLFIFACHLEAPDIIMEMNRGEHLKKICAYDKSRDTEKHSDNALWSDKPSTWPEWEGRQSHSPVVK